MKFVGKKILLRYANGMEIIGDYKTSTEMSWEALAGPAKGMKGTERIQAVEISPEIFFISWFEESGTTVSQVLNFNKSTVVAYITFETGQGRQSALEKGTFTEIK